MSQQIRFFHKNKLDISNKVATLTASEGNAFVDFVRNRSNTTAWVTTASVDGNLTNIVVDFVDLINLDFILLIKHNFKAYTIQYWNGSAYVNFSTPISETTNTLATTFHQFNEVYTTKIKLIVQGTMVANSDKYLFQFIASTQRGQLDAWPVIKSPKHSRSRVRSKLISGKETIKEQISAFSCQLQVKILRNDADLSIIEGLYDANTGFLVWLSGGDDSQFSSKRIGYRKEDIYLMKCSDEYEPEFYKGFYTSGLVINVSLVEVAD